MIFCFEEKPEPYKYRINVVQTHHDGCVGDGLIYENRTTAR